MNSAAVISVHPTEIGAAPGQEVRFPFVTVGDEAVAYRVQCAEAAMSAWCRLLLPAVRAGPGELVVDVPADARPGHYPLRLVASAEGREIAAADLTLHVKGERCLRIVALPKFSLQPDGSVLVTLRVVNCGIVDANILLRARHEDGWSFSVDSPELTIAVGKGPVTVKVTLRPPTGRKVDRGDRITVEVETGTGWQPLPGRVPRPIWPWVAAAAVVTGATVGALSALWPEADNNVRITAGRDTTTTTGQDTTDTTGQDTTTTTGQDTTTTTGGGAETPGSPAPPLVFVPDVVGETEDRATAILEGAGFVAATEPVDGAAAEPGTVVEQHPAPLTEAQAGATITIGVAVGPDLVTVPQVVGLPEDQAREILEERGFDVTSVAEDESAEPAGIVIRSDPVGDTKVPIDSTGVALVVSSGPPSGID